MSRVGDWLRGHRPPKRGGNRDDPNKAETRRVVDLAERLQGALPGPDGDQEVVRTWVEEAHDCSTQLTKLGLGLHARILHRLVDYARAEAQESELLASLHAEVGNHCAFGDGSPPPGAIPFLEELIESELAALGKATGTLEHLGRMDMRESRFARVDRLFWVGSKVTHDVPSSRREPSFVTADDKRIAVAVAVKTPEYRRLVEDSYEEFFDVDADSGDSGDALPWWTWLHLVQFPAEEDREEEDRPDAEDTEPRQAMSELLVNRDLEWRDFREGRDNEPYFGHLDDFAKWVRAHAVAAGRGETKR